MLSQETARLLQATDWSRTPLGPRAEWPATLRLALGICQSSRFPMFVWWGEELINIYNDAYVPVLGKRHPAAFGQPARDIWQEIWPVIGPQADLVMTKGEATWNDRVLLVMERQGYTEETYFTWSYSPIHGESGKVEGLFCACKEETEAVLAERAVEHASRMKDEFLATLSHELRTPLNAILGWTRLLSVKPALPEDVRQAVAVIERNARAQATIIQDLLDMSAIISGKVRLDSRPLDIASVVRAAIVTSMPAAQAKQIALVASVDATEPVMVAGDPGRLQQVVWNLLSNAVKFTPRGGRIEVGVTRDATNAEIRVSDSGAGIGPEFLPCVFDRFRQADASPTRRHGGLGLGLSIVKQLVELHGGTIRVTSEGEGKGATFVVSLPLAGGTETSAIR